MKNTIAGLALAAFVCLGASGCVVTQAQIGTDISVGATLGCNLAGIVASATSSNTTGKVHVTAAKLKASINKVCPGVVVDASIISDILARL